MRNSMIWNSIYCNIKQKHPDWSHKRVLSCTRFAYRKRFGATNEGNKDIEETDMIDSFLSEFVIK